MDRQQVGVHVDLERADARRQVEDPGHGAALELRTEPLMQRMHAGAQREVEHHVAVLDQARCRRRCAGT